jgi:hypothetical protein
VGAEVQTGRGICGQAVLRPANDDGTEGSGVVCCASGDLIMFQVPPTIQSKFSLPERVLGMFFDNEEEWADWPDDALAFMRQDIYVPGESGLIRRSHFGSAIPLEDFVKVLDERGIRLHGRVVSLAVSRQDQDYPLVPSAAHRDLFHDPAQFGFEDLIASFGGGKRSANDAREEVATLV